MHLIFLRVSVDYFPSLKVRGKLDRIKGLGEESSDEDDAGKWIEKQRRKVAAKEAAEKRAKELEELDNEFGVEVLVSNSLKEDRQTEYDRKNLKGLKVGMVTLESLNIDSFSSSIGWAQCRGFRREVDHIDPG